MTMLELPPTALAERVDRIAAFRVVQVLERAYEMERQGRHVVHLEVGEPDFPSAPAIIDAGIAALEAGHTGYTQALGLPALREAIAASYGVLGVGAERVAVTTGASAALNLLMQILVNPGDEVLIADPGYPCNSAFVEAAGGSVRGVPVDAGTRFQLTADQLTAAWRPRTKGVLLASPSNPTGSALTAAELASIRAFVAGKGFVVVDEIYRGLVYDGDGVPPCLAVDNGFFVVNSFSKYYGMTGWRLGWVVVPDWAMDALDRVAQNLYLAPPTVAQYAALAALTPAATLVHEQRRRVFARRRDVLLAGLDALGLPAAHRPEGSFYVYADVSSTGLDADALCARLIEEFGVAATPGTDFGSHRASDYVRFAFTVDEQEIRIGLDRLEAALRTFGGGS